MVAVSNCIIGTQCPSPFPPPSPPHTYMHVHAHTNTYTSYTNTRNHILKHLHTYTSQTLKLSEMETWFYLVMFWTSMAISSKQRRHTPSSFVSDTTSSRQAFASSASPTRAFPWQTLQRNYNWIVQKMLSTSLQR